MDAHRIRERLRDGRPLLLDGGLATELEARGHDLSDALWSARLLVENPGAIADAHLAFYRAGAEVATTASYQASFEGFAARGLAAGDATRLLGASVELAAGARDRALRGGAAGPLFVAASIGPYGAMLADGSEYRGRYGLDRSRLRDIHRARLAVLAASEADVLAVETIPEVDEAAAIGDLLVETSGAAAWISFTCADDARLRGGAPIEEAVLAVAGTPGVLAVGVNCTAPEHVEALLARMAAVTSLPLVAYPNSGEGWDAATRRWTGRPGADVDGAAVRRWVAAGARLVGGCCRVRPAAIASMGRALGARAA